MSGFDDYMLPCLNKKLFGYECLGCGMQRSAALVLQGEFVQAFYMYPAIYTLILFFGVIIFNLFKPFKYASKLINILGLVSVSVIIISFILKQLN